MMKDDKLTESIKKTTYYYTDNSRFLFEVSKLNKEKFSANGSDLCICLLSLNRVSLTIRLLSSIEYYIKGFKGEVLIVDNNSTLEQKLRLKEFISTSTVTVRLIELEENLGVGNARNHAVTHTNKDWVMFLDNDMFFISNPLASIKETIEGLGVHFLNLPLINYDSKTVFALGGALFTWPMKDTWFAGGGSCYNLKREVEYNDVKIGEPFLSDFLFGGASVVNKNDFIGLDGFDRNMFVGFEDIDFSLQLYNKGYKVGNINEFVLVHNHKPSSNVDDVEAEKKRFNNGLIKSAAEAFQRKNGLIVYDDNTEEWIKQKQEQLIHKAASDQQADTKILKRIALIADVKDWAFHNIAKNIQNYLSDKYEFTIYFSSDFEGTKWLDIYPILFQKKYDMLFFFWRPIFGHLFSNDLMNHLEHNHNISRAEFENFLNQTVLITGVYDHLFLSEENINRNRNIFTNNIDGYFVASNKLKYIYENIEGYLKPYSVIQDGVDPLKFFKKIGKIKNDSKDRPLVVGWAGNSNWGVSEDGIDHKGFNTIIKPAIEELVKEGHNIKLLYADKQDPATYIPSSEMNDFYNKLDVYICTSDIEGTPNPVLEGMSCGLGIVSTDVGIVKEVFGKEQQRFILEERTKDCLKEKLLLILNDRTIIEKLAAENAIRIANWSWESKCEIFDEMFEYYFHKQAIGHLHHKTFPFGYRAVLQEEIKEASIHDATIQQEIIPEDDSPIRAYQVDWNKYIDKEEYDAVNREKIYWEKNNAELKKWYGREYDVLPLWYKRFGHIIKVFQGKRTVKSLFSKNEE